MSPELTVLASLGLLSLALAVLTIAIHFRRYGGKMIRSNRDDFPPLDGLAARVVRAHGSLHEALLPFAVLVLVAQALHVTSAVTVYAAAGFLAARLAHAVLYLLGATPWRSLSYYAGLAATVVLACQLPWAGL
jgi:uncharacterized MAPEG superfamily protein